MASGYQYQGTLGASWATIAAGPPSNTRVQALTVNFCNSASTPQQVYLATTTTGTTTPAATDYIEYLSAVAPNGVVERSKIILGYGQILLAYAPTGNIQCNVFGIEGNASSTASGVMSRNNLTATTWTNVSGTPSSGRIRTCTVNFCNRNTTPVQIYLAYTTAPAGPGASQYIEANFTIAAYGVLERTALLISNGYYLSAYASAANVTVTCWGVDDIA